MLEMGLRNGKKKIESEPKKKTSGPAVENSFQNYPDRGPNYFDTDTAEDSFEWDFEAMDANPPGPWPSHRRSYPLAPLNTPNSMMSSNSQPAYSPYPLTNSAALYTPEYVRAVIGLPPLQEEAVATTLNPNAPAFSASVPNSGFPYESLVTISVNTTTTNTATSTASTTLLPGGASSVHPQSSRPILNEHQLHSSTYTTAGTRRLPAFPPVYSESNTDQLLVALMQKLDTGFSRLSGSIQTMSQVPRAENPPNPRTAPNDAISRLENMVSNLANHVQALGERMDSASTSASPHTTHQNPPSRGAPTQIFENPVPVYRTWPHKWKVKYDGDNNKLPIEFFLDQIIVLKESNDVTWETVICSFPQFLEGDASKWFYRYRRSNRNLSRETTLPVHSYAIRAM